MSLRTASGHRKRAVLWGALVGACVYAAVAATIVVVGVRGGGEGRISAMLALMLTGLPLTLFGLALGRATLADLVLLAIIGELQWTAVGALFGRWLDRRAGR
jgi:hypothetical protein